MIFSLAGYFLLPECDSSKTAGQRAWWVHGGQLCIPWDVLAIRLRVEKTPAFAKLEVLPCPLGSC